MDHWKRSSLVDYPSRRPNPCNLQSRQAHFVEQSNSSNTIDPNWYFDIGATDHVTRDFQNMTIVDDYQGIYKLQDGNGKKKIISHIGSSALHNLRLPFVLVVPQITKRLLSVSKMSSNNDVYLQFYCTRCFFKSLQGKTLLTRDVKDGLYRVPSPLNKLPNKSPHIMALSGVRTSLHGWHKRLAHPHTPLLKHLLYSFKFPTSSKHFPTVYESTTIFL